MKPYYLIYLAFFTMALDNFPLMFGSAYKPVSLIFLAIYFVLKMPEIIRMKWNRMEFFIFFLFVLSFVISAIMVLYRGYHFTGLLDGIFSFFAGVVIYLAIKHFILKSALHIRLQSLKMLLYGYTIPIVIGLLQLIYIYIAPVGIFANIIAMFVERIDFMNTGRVHFTFSEPSFTSIHTNLIMIPTLFLLKKFKSINGYIKTIVVLFLMISVMTLSIRYYMDVAVALILYFFLFTQVKNIFKLFIIVPAAIGILAFVLNFTGGSQDNYHAQRFLNVMEQPEEIFSDPSFQIRNTYTDVGLKAFQDNYWVGVGIGNYVEYYKENVRDINPNFDVFPELYGAFKESEVLSQYNMYTRLLSEMGILGIAVLVIMLGVIVNMRYSRNKLFFSILLMWTLIQFDSFAFIPMYLIMAINSRSWKEKEIETEAARKEKSASTWERQEKYPILLDGK